MIALTIQPQEDGTVLVAPAAQPLDPQQAETFQDLQQALQAAGEVLGNPQGQQGGGEQGPAEEQEEGPMGHNAEEEAAEPPMPSSGSSMGPGDMEPSQDPEADMMAGYKKAKKGR